MKLADTIILALAVVFIIISVYEIITKGIAHAYWAVMLGIILFFVYNYRKNAAKKS